MNFAGKNGLLFDATTGERLGSWSHIVSRCVAGMCFYSSHLGGGGVRAGLGFQKSGKCHELSRKPIQIVFTHPTPGRGGSCEVGVPGGLGLGVKITKVQ